MTGVRIPRPSPWIRHCYSWVTLHHIKWSGHWLSILEVHCRLAVGGLSTFCFQRSSDIQFLTAQKIVFFLKKNHTLRRNKYMVLKYTWIILICERPNISCLGINLLLVDNTKRLETYFQLSHTWEGSNQSRVVKPVSK